MPYIKQVDRELYDNDIESVLEFIQVNTTLHEAPSLLVKAIKNILLGSYEKWLPNYADYNEIIGVLECSRLEFLCRKGAKSGKPAYTIQPIDKKTASALKRRTNRLVNSVLAWYEGECTSTSGQLNYIITRLLLLFNSQIVNFINPVNILDAVKLDIYQNEVAPYEQLKEAENGSVNSNILI